MFNVLKPLSIISERTAKMKDERGKKTDAGKLFRITWGELYGNSHYRADFSFELRINKVFKTTRYICMNFSSLGHKFKLKFKLL
jgi:hypothetical protein